jgi:hypothetical protein
VIALAKIAILLLADALQFVTLWVRPGRRALTADNLFLRRRLALYRERGASGLDATLDRIFGDHTRAS